MSKTYLCWCTDDAKDDRFVATTRAENPAEAAKKFVIRNLEVEDGMSYTIGVRENAKDEWLFVEVECVVSDPTFEIRDVNVKNQHLQW